MLLLAFAPEELKNAILEGPLEQFTAATATDAEELGKRLEMIRADGFNIAINDLDEGAFSIAAPIVDASQEVIASLSVAGAMARYDESRRRRFLSLVQSASAEISGKLGLAVAA